MKIRNKYLKFKKVSFFLSFFIICCTLPAYAYGGPGLGLGAILVFITVAITFFASLFITFFKYIKVLLVNIKKFFKKKEIKNKRKKS